MSGGRYLEESYGVEVELSEISTIINAVLDEVRAQQARSLEDLSTPSAATNLLSP